MLWLWLLLGIVFIFAVVAEIISEGLRDTLVELVFLLSFFGLVNGVVIEPVYPLLRRIGFPPQKDPESLWVTILCGIVFGGTVLIMHLLNQKERISELEKELEEEKKRRPTPKWKEDHEERRRAAAIGITPDWPLSKEEEEHEAEIERLIGRKERAGE